MQELALNAVVECKDGTAGKSTHIIFDPESQQITHFVVKDARQRDAQDRLVPIARVEASDHGTIRLNCTLDEVAQMPEYSEHHFITYQYQDYSTREVSMEAGVVRPVTKSAASEIVDEHVPKGLRALASGAKVEATDGVVGEVDEFHIDPATGQITHFTLREGHFWGKRQVTLPLSVVRFADEDMVALHLDKAAIAQLPTTPIKRKYQGDDHPKAVELVGRLFDQPGRAADTLQHVKEMQHAQHNAFRLLNAAVLVKQQDGTTSVEETGELTAKRGGAIGALTGGLIGALAGPVGIVVGAIAGATAGAVSPKWIDLGFPNEFLDRLRNQLQPGSSALIVLVEHDYLSGVTEALAGLGGEAIDHTLTDSVVEELMAEQKPKGD